MVNIYFLLKYKVNGENGWSLIEDKKLSVWNLINFKHFLKYSTYSNTNKDIICLSNIDDSCSLLT